MSSPPCSITIGEAVAEFSSRVSLLLESRTIKAAARSVLFACIFGIFNSRLSLTVG